jgi:glycosyltransferase involved in cell wall biosynthesis
MGTNVKLCFIALGAYPLIVNETSTNIIGPDVHQFILGKELNNHKFNISFIVYSNKGSSIEYVNDMTIVKVKDYEKSAFPKLMKVLGIWKAMRKANSDIYFHTGGVPGVVLFFCRFKRKRFIFEVASDAIVDRNVISKNNKQFRKSIFHLDNILTFFDIKCCDHIIVQSERQKKSLLKNYGRDGTLIKMILPFPQNVSINKPNSKKVLWVGSMSEVKQPEIFLKLAQKFPEYKFQMIGGNSGDIDLYNSIKTSSESLTNLDFVGVVPFHEISQYFSNAAVLVNTSMFEGFPNAFIQAWMNSVPVISLNSNPDNLITDYELGFHSKTFDRLILDLKKLLTDNELRKEMGNKGRDYVEREHNFRHIIEKYVDLFSFYGGYK